MFKNLQKGETLFITLVIMTIFLAIGLGISTIIISQFKMIGEMGYSVKAFYAADSGIERISYENKLCQQQSPPCSSPCRADCLARADTSDLQNIQVGEARYSVQVPEPLVFHSKGEFGETARAIEITLPYYKRVFVTSQTFNGDLVTSCCVLYGLTTGGTCNILGLIKCYTAGNNPGDLICQKLAELAGLPGNYKAWLSIWLTHGTTSVKDRFTYSTIPYRLVDSTLIANNWDDLIDSTLINPINKNESGATVNQYVFTNTNPDGSFFSTTENCSNWDSNSPGVTRIGYSGATDGGWTSCGSGSISPSFTPCEGVGYCPTPGFGINISLYCFQQ